MRKWVILIIIIAIGGILFGTFLEQKKPKVVGKILNSIPFIDSITVKDGKTKEEILTLTNLDPSISDMAEIYKLPYLDLKWAERKLLKKDPFVEVEYLKNNEIQYKVSIYQVDEESMQSINTGISGDSITYSYSYSPKEKNASYIFAIKENYQLLGVNEGLKELLNIVISKSNID